MDGIFILVVMLAAGDLLLARWWWRERARRRKAERTADTYIRDNYRLVDALERKAALKRTGPIVVRMGAADDASRQIRQAVDELHARQAAQTGGVA